MAPRILVVDDEPDVELLFRQIYRRKLRSGEVAFEFVSDGVEALERLRDDETLAAVFTDINMPRMDGLTLLNEVQALPREIPVVILSAYGDMANIRTAMNRGAFDFLTKPVDFNDLETTRVKVVGRVEEIAEREARRGRSDVEGGSPAKESAPGSGGLGPGPVRASSLELAAGIAHEIRNPLNFILSFSRLTTDLVAELKDDLGAIAEAMPRDTAVQIGETVDLIADNVSRINEHGTRAESIISSMLGRAKGIAGKKEPTDLHALLDAQLSLAVDTARSAKPELAVAVSRRYEPGMPELVMDPLSMGRALLIVLNNAFDAVGERLASEGGAYRPALAVSTERRADLVEIRIRDNGPGIAESDLARIFLPRFSTKHDKLGVGLGLALSHEVVVSQHKGEIFADSVEGEYAEFVIVLPLDQGPS